MCFWSYPESYDVTPFRGNAADDASSAPMDARLTVDQRLAKEVAQALLGSPAVTGGIVDLRVQNGVAILDGTLDSDDARTAAIAVAESVPGIRDVCDALVVS